MPRRKNSLSNYSSASPPLRMGWRRGGRSTRACREYGTTWEGCQCADLGCGPSSTGSVHRYGVEGEGPGDLFIGAIATSPLDPLGAPRNDIQGQGNALTSGQARCLPSLLKQEKPIGAEAIALCNRYEQSILFLQRKISGDLWAGTITSTYLQTKHNTVLHTGVTNDLRRGVRAQGQDSWRSPVSATSTSRLLRKPLRSLFGNCARNRSGGSQKESLLVEKDNPA
jgi:hypothetical protein